LGRRRPGKGPFFSAEQLAFNQFPGQGRTVHLHQCPFAVRAEFVNGSGHKLFAHPGFPHDQHRRIRGGDLLNSVQHIFNRFAPADDIFKVVLQFDFILQVVAFGFQLVFQLLDLHISGVEFDFSLLSIGDVAITGAKTYGTACIIGHRLANMFDPADLAIATVNAKCNFCSL
jgi:hypothetical protein